MQLCRFFSVFFFFFQQVGFDTNFYFQLYQSVIPYFSFQNRILLTVRLKYNLYLFFWTTHYNLQTLAVVFAVFAMCDLETCRNQAKFCHWPGIAPVAKNLSLPAVPQ